MLNKFQNSCYYISLKFRFLNLHSGYLPENRCKDIAYNFSYMSDVDYVTFESKSTVAQPDKHLLRAPSERTVTFLNVQCSFI
jgi:hypothetical protein